MVLVVDGSTDRAFLERMLRELWQYVPADAPNRELGRPEVRLFETRKQSPAELRALVVALFSVSAARANA